MFDFNKLLRSNIKNLVPYSSARDEFKGKEGIFLDANENSFGSPFGENQSRYPDPVQTALKEKISKIKSVPVENIFLGNGSDEAIDLLYRTFCEPGRDSVIICPPTYGMYEVAAHINDVGVKKINLLPEIFQLDTANIFSAIDSNTKLIFLCCPNNPTGNGVKWSDIKQLLEKFHGLVVVDEAYIDFASYRSLVEELSVFPNLIILQTLSKAWGLAGLRIGIAFASAEIIRVFNKTKPPYNISAVSQSLALEALDHQDLVLANIRKIVLERDRVTNELSKFLFVEKIYSGEANFILVRMKHPRNVYEYLAKNNIVVRDRSMMALCEGCLRITIGTNAENDQLIKCLKLYSE